MIRGDPEREASYSRRASTDPRKIIGKCRQQLNLAPGTRSGIVPDERLHAFLAALAELEVPLNVALEQWDEAESD